MKKEHTLTPRQVFDKYRSMHAMLQLGKEEYYVRVQICGFFNNNIIVAFKDMEGPIKEFHKGVLFDEGWFEGIKAKSYMLVKVNQLTFIDHHATERLDY